MKLAIVALLVVVFASGAFAGSKLRFLTVRNGDHIVVKGQRLNCLVTKGSFYCAEVNKFPRLSFLALTEGGDRRKGVFILYRTEWFGAQMETLAEYSR